MKNNTQMMDCYNNVTSEANKCKNDNKPFCENYMGSFAILADLC